MSSEDVNQGIPLAFVAIQTFQILASLEVARIDAERLLQAIDRVVDLAWQLLAHLRHAHQEMHSVGVGRRDLELMLQDLKVRVHSAGLLVQLLQRLQRGQVLRIDGQHLLVRLHRPLVVAQAGLPQLANL